MSTVAEISEQALATYLLRQVGLGEVRSVQPLPGGRNNRVFRLEATSGTYLLKRYYWDPADSRDRLGNEFAFLEHAARNGCRMTPRPIFADRSAHAALMEFVVGARIGLEDVDAATIEQACEFFRQTNTVAARAGAAAMPRASEACFSMAEHVATTQRRVDRVQQAGGDDAIAAAVIELVRDRLTLMWEEVKLQIAAGWPDLAGREAPLAATERCLSPSDFGFHNSLREAGGGIRFLDFEYAGWDDPAKLICDFANQPDMILPRALSDRFCAAAIAQFDESAALARRVEALEPLYQIKWACICLNDFLPSGRRRFEFAPGKDADHRQRREFQLSQARRMLDRVASTPAPVATPL